MSGVAHPICLSNKALWKMQKIATSVKSMEVYCTGDLGYLRDLGTSALAFQSL
jgi:hypothetical protein